MKQNHKTLAPPTTNCSFCRTGACWVSRTATFQAICLPPSWFNTCAISGQTSQQARNAIFAFRSTDAGKNWSLLSVSDAAVVSGGDFGWPQGGGSHVGNGSGGVGGFDRC